MLTPRPPPQLLGPVHKEDVDSIFSIIEDFTKNGELTNGIDVGRLRGLVNNLAGVVAVLEKGLGRRKVRKHTQTQNMNADFAPEPKKSNKPPIPAVKSPTPMRRVVSTNSLSLLQDHTTKPAVSMGGDLAYGGRNPIASDNKSLVRNNKTMRAQNNNVVILDALRDQCRDKLRNFAQGFKAMLKNPAAPGPTRDAADRLTFLLSMENGFIWNDNYASTQLDLGEKRRGPRGAKRRCENEY